MNLPILEKSVFTVKVDSIELNLQEATLGQIESISTYKEIKEGDAEIVDKLAEVIVSLMGSYEGTVEEKRAFVKSMSVRQIGLIVEGLMNSVKLKKVPAGSEKSSS